MGRFRAARFRSIKAWQHAYQLTLDVYRATSSFPKSELYGLTSQLRRASASIAANIAEGSSRSSRADFLRFLEIALGSLREVECFLMLARDLETIAGDKFDQLNDRAIETGRTLCGLITSLKQEPR